MNATAAGPRPRRAATEIATLGQPAKRNLDQQLDAMLRPGGENPDDRAAEAVATQGVPHPASAPASAADPHSMQGSIDQMLREGSIPPLGELDQSIAHSADEMLMRGDFQTVDDVLLEADGDADASPEIPAAGAAGSVDGLEGALDELAGAPAASSAESASAMASAGEAPASEPAEAGVAASAAEAPPDASAQALAQELLADEALGRSAAEPRVERSAAAPPQPQPQTAPRRGIGSVLVRAIAILFSPVVAVLVFVNQPLAGLSPVHRNVVGLIGVITLCIGATMVTWALHGQLAGLLTLGGFAPLTALLVYLSLIRRGAALTTERISTSAGPATSEVPA